MKISFQEIIKVLSDNTGISQKEIINGAGWESQQVQQMLCFIVVEYFPEYKHELAKIIKGHRIKYKSCTSRIKTSKKMLININKILKKLSLAPTGIKADDYKESWRNAKRVFGIENTLYDEIEIMDAIEHSNDFFKSYGQGLQPKYTESDLYL